MPNPQNPYAPDKAWAFIGMFLPLIGFVLVLLFRSKNGYALFYAKQGLLLGIASILLRVVSIVPVLGSIVSWIGVVLLTVLWVLGLVYAVSGEEKGLPVIGELAEQF